jgi:hypothetical protein
MKKDKDGASKLPFKFDDINQVSYILFNINYFDSAWWGIRIRDRIKVLFTIKQLTTSRKLFSTNSVVYTNTKAKSHSKWIVMKRDKWWGKYLLEWVECVACVWVEWGEWECVGCMEWVILCDGFYDFEFKNIFIINLIQEREICKIWYHLPTLFLKKSLCSGDYLNLIIFSRFFFW